MTTGDNESGATPPAGWYPDPTNPGHERLWTGERWIAWIRPNRVDRREGSPAGWREDLGDPGFERLWSGEMWTEEVRRAGEAGPAGPGAPAAADRASSAPALRPPLSPAHREARFRDDLPPDKLGTLGKWLCAALVAIVAAGIAEIVADQLYLGVLGDVIGGRAPALGHAESVVDAVVTTRGVYALVWFAVVILFMVWFYRAYRNLVRAGIRDLRFAPGWAIGGWFIPFFNLVRPKQVANDIWKGSASAATVGAERRGELGLPALLNWWWVLWILGGLLVGLGNAAISRAGARRLYEEVAWTSERNGVWATQLGIAVQIAAAILLIVLVLRISRLQDEHFAVPAEVDGGGAEATKTCPDCAEHVKAAARVCRYCGYRFDAAG